MTADVVALDQPFMWNRLGAAQPQGMMYALEADVVSKDGSATLAPGNVMLRPGKRPRPLTLRMNEGDCLEIHFTNLLARVRVNGQQPATRNASIHVNGLQLVGGITSDGSNVGTNPAGGVVAPGTSVTYTLYAEHEGTHLMYSAGAMTGGEGNNSSIASGLFGAVNVEPRGSEWYRSQLTQADMEMATVGTTPGGQPILDYDAVYPGGHALAGRPILKILAGGSAGGSIVHSDLNAIITGQERGPLGGDWSYPDATVNRDREQPFREFTVIFHDEAGAVQAFPQFNDEQFQHTLHSVRDAFAINYGTGGIGAEILANRLGLGPMRNCNECKYEEFFLSSWAVGDPAMVVDVPANAGVDPATGEVVDPTLRATTVYYPDDPSNVFHSYLNDHVKIRNLHAGPKEHHIFHLHAHQWLSTPDADNSTYMDSQAVGPGSEYTYEITYDGGGNRNKTPGDAIFHCHFYPHFAQGMWALWRNHDVFEAGTVLVDGIPAAGSRALPDGEIAAGTPIPAVVPIPGQAMAPMPNETFAGYPFYIPAVAGHRPPTAPLDLVHDGGLPRHVVVDDQTQMMGDHPVSGNAAAVTPGSSGTAISWLTPLDMSKENTLMNALQLPDAGTWVEKEAMAFHASWKHDSWVQPRSAQLGGDWNDVAANFLTSGAPPKPGAPFADPCVTDNVAPGMPVVAEYPGKLRTYRSADIQIDAKINKAGWHVPQHRMRALWGDVEGLMDGTQAPEPLFFRANTGDCVQYVETNLVPKDYEMDDFQVRTPTDVIGAHIHLVKFDVTSSDGSANGFNYEDGALAPGEVVERIHAINATHPDFPGVGGGLIVNDGTTTVDLGAPTRIALEAEPHPFFGAGKDGEWLGARTNIQRWYVDEVLNAQGEDRTLRTVFTHDHYGPSTHQQVGLYASLVAEPAGSEWRDPDTEEMIGSRAIAHDPSHDRNVEVNPGDPVTDGGPTSWNADILLGEDSYREFMFQTADFALAYQAGKGVDANGHPIPDPLFAINPPGKVEQPLPFLVARPDVCPNGMAPPCPEAISADDPGTMLVNYRNEPLALRVRDPNTNTQATGLAGDLSYAFSSRPEIVRADPAFNTQPGFYPDLTADVQPGDPFTPMMRAYEGDKVQVRIQNGAQEEGHNFTIHGARWLFEPSWANSGWRNSQMNGISEHFELVMPNAPTVKGGLTFEDYLYQGGAATDDLWNGMWGIMRVYSEARGDLPTLPNNPDGKAEPVKNGQSELNFNGVCPVLPDPPTGGGRKATTGAQPWEPQNRKFSVVAALARDILPEGTLVYNQAPGTGPGQTLHDPTAILFVNAQDLTDGKLKPGVPVEPLVLRANAGDCIFVTLENRLPADLPDLDGWNTLPMIVDNFNNNDITPSAHVGLHPQLVTYDMANSDGANVGFNPVQTAAPGGGIVKYKWYAGDVQVIDGVRTAIPMEFGATALMSSDRIKHAGKGAIGALIIEPQYSTWVTDYEQGIGQLLRAAATVHLHDDTGTPVKDASGKDKVFRELAIQFQDDVNLRTGTGDGAPVENLAEAEDSEDSGQKALNYRTEPMWNRLGFEPDTPLNGGGHAGSNGATNDLDFSTVLLNATTGRDPVTPVLEAKAGTETRLRVTQSGGHARNHVLIVHGHSWQELPWVDASNKIGDNVDPITGRQMSREQGAQHGIGPTSHFNMVLSNGAGGKFKVPGDYLYRDMASFTFDGGMWGILRVIPENQAYSTPPSGDPGSNTGGGGKKKKN